MPAWKAENNIYNLPWPTQSQDMNITANIWTFKNPHQAPRK